MIEEVLKITEDLALPPLPSEAAFRINEEVMPALLEARTYIETGFTDAPEVLLAVDKASYAAKSISDTYPAMAYLLSKIRSFQEEVIRAAHRSHKHD